MLSERMHTVYSGAISVEQHKKGMTDVRDVIVMLLCVCVCMFVLYVCRYNKPINEREGVDK